jgi:hypothetical protein
VEFLIDFAFDPSCDPTEGEDAASPSALLIENFFLTKPIIFSKK